jgi:hypothetical protein
MVKGNIPPANISLVLDSGVRMLIARRSGQTGQGAPHLAANYKIREGSQQKTLIGGHQALRAIGELEQNGKPFVELLAWIDTEQTRTFFVMKTAAENLGALQEPFEQMLQSTRIP